MSKVIAMKDEVLLWICTVLLAMHPGCKCDSDQSRAAKAQQKLAQLGTIMHVSFPPSTRLLNYDHTQGWLDDSIILKVEIARDDLEFFLNNSPFAGKTLKTKQQNPIPAIGTTGPRWWKVKSVENWQSGSVALPQAEWLKILLDLDKPDKVVIYLDWFET
ncbi:MAG: hypothetical protein ACYS83_08605 [Planctomycetota bacterium]|jgi:hypothetical protein